MPGFISPNYTMTPNDLLDELMPLMGEAELRIVLAAIRKTLGYHRTSDEISRTQFEKMTGLSRQGVEDGVQAAIARGVMREVARGKRGVIRYALVIESDQSTKLTSQASRPVPVNVLDQSEASTSQRSRHTKEKDSSKEKGKKNSAPKGATGKSSSSKSKGTSSTVPQALMTPMKNAIFAAFEYTDWNALTEPERGVIQKTARELILAGYSPSDVSGLYEYCTDRFDDFTPRALSTHASEARKEGYVQTPATTMPDTPARVDAASEKSPVVYDEEIDAMFDELKESVGNV
jgi:phage replication O-like protein O